MIPPWVDRAQYPFEPKTFDTGEGVIRYVDVGDGPAVVMVHGTPTWSFLWRHVIRELAPTFRCIAPDQLGFGLSDKPRRVSYRPQEQTRRLAGLLEATGPESFMLLVHDVGGPIGLAYALDRPDRVRRLVLFNTWLWPLEGDRHIARFATVAGSVLGRVLYEWFGLSVRGVWRSALRDRRRYTAAVHAHYARALPRGARYATWVCARELIGSSAWYASLWERRERLRAIPAMLVWGLADPAFGTFLPRWQALFGAAEVMALDGVGHAPMEERGPEVARRVADFLAR